MLWTLESLINSVNSCATQIDGKYVPARPLLDPWSWRIKHAWGVLTGKYDAVKWPGNQ